MEKRDNTYQDDMDKYFIAEYGEVIEGKRDFQEFLTDWGYTEEELNDYLDSRPELLNSDDMVDDPIPEDLDMPDLSMPEDGKFKEMSADEAEKVFSMLPIGGIGSLAKKGGGMLSKFLNDTFASKGLKAAQKANRGSTGEVVKGTSRKLKDSNLRPSIPTKTADRYKSMADKVKGDRAAKAVAGTTAAAIVGGAIDRGLSGNRNAQGDFIDLNKIARGDDEVGVEEAPESMGNQFGYHKQEGQNFWTVNNDDPYWDSHEMGTGDAWSDAEVKKAPAKELDWSSWFN